MTDASTAEEPKKKSSRLPLIVGLVLCVAGGAGGYFAVASGLFGGGHGATADATHEGVAPAPLAPASFVALDPLTISLPPRSDRNHLRFTAQLDVAPAYRKEVEAIRPRIMDVLNEYLRAVELSDIEDPSALVRLRAQMLRRLQVVAGDGRINDLLIMEFVLS